MKNSQDQTIFSEGIESVMVIIIDKLWTEANFGISIDFYDLNFHETDENRTEKIRTIFNSE